MPLDDLNYYGRFDLIFDPFLKNSKFSYFESKDSKEALLRLKFLQQAKGFAVMTGNPGCGKTTCIREWCKNLPGSLYKVCYSSLSTLTVHDFYRELASNLGGQPAFRKTDNFHIIQNEIIQLASNKRITPVIIIDEANHLGPSVLTDLKILFNFEMDSKDRAIILLAGNQQLNYSLKLSVHESIRQRIIMNYHMSGLTEKECAAYIQHRLKDGSCRMQIFDDQAANAIVSASNGIPRMLNKICSRCLLIADAQKRNTVNLEVAMSAINDCELGI